MTQPKPLARHTHPDVPRKRPFPPSPPSICTLDFVAVVVAVGCGAYPVPDTGTSGEAQGRRAILRGALATERVGAGAQVSES